MVQSDLVIVGSLNWDINFFAQRIPKIGEEVVATRIERSPGGKGGNVAVAAARILGRSKVSLVGCIGKDEPGKKQIAALKEAGVDTSGVRTLAQAESGQAYVTIDPDGNDTILTHFGANAMIDEAQIMSPKTQTLLANCKLIVTVGSPRRAVHRVLSEARRLRKTVVWHPGVLTRLGMKEWHAKLKQVEYLILNQHEIVAFTGTESFDSAFELLDKEAHDTRVIVTLGSRGASYSHQGKRRRIGGVDVTRLGKKIISTAGCGDAFVGAFAAYKSIGSTDEDALAYANMAGALKATVQETRGSPSRQELEENYRRYQALSTKPD